ncbi:hypothetical protein [Poseidonocella sp. HB161398]|uniref:MGH1-like glycoside hydrolase domain-containing protein n=1 Tax=Poseidonocella sp. HB161398 TaxID=2320855 RepID=UPI001108CF9B|nr:hypothetical protein [Poseidonocella sp. HB161398]
MQAIKDELDRRAIQIMRDNDRGGYTIPTHGLYPYQWNWDSAFAALGFAAFDPARAWRELEILFSGQWLDGMVPHILFHRPDPGYFPGPDVWQCRGPLPSSGITQPPVSLSFARRLYEANPAMGAVPVRMLFDPMRRWVQWFMAWRSHEGAICIAHPWESGRDNAADWDKAMAAIDPHDVGTYQRRDLDHVHAAMRPTKDDYDRYIWLVQRGRRMGWHAPSLAVDQPFFVADPTMTFTLMRGVRDLIWLGEQQGLPTASLWNDLQLLEKGAETLWNPEISAYDSRNALDGEFSGTLSNASFLAWYGGIDRPELAETLMQVLRPLPYGVPSLALQDERFDPKRYWRGPVWGVLNMLVGMGLEEFGYPQGPALRQMTGRLIASHGFAEYFDPRDGAPAGGGSFTWTAAVWLAWAGVGVELG